MLSCAGCYASYGTPAPRLYNPPPHPPVDDHDHGNSTHTHDLHKGEFCVDVSEWGPVQWNIIIRENCTTTFVKKTQIIPERVSLDMLVCTEKVAII